MFLVKYLADGQNVWTKIISGDSYSYGQGVSVASDGSIYVTGESDGTLFDGETLSGNNDAFLIKFSADGQKVWTKILIGDNYSSGKAVSVASDGSIYITGEATGSLFDGETLSGNGDMFLVKYSAEGQKVWTKIERESYGNGVSVASDGSIYVTGGGAVPPIYQQHVVLSKYFADGTKIWTKIISGDDDSNANGVSVASDGSVYLTGRAYGTIFNGETISNNNSMILCKFPSELIFSSITIDGNQIYENATYTASAGTTSVAVSVILTDNTSTYTVSGNTGLRFGTTTITITVTKSDNTTSDHYIFVVIPYEYTGATISEPTKQYITTIAIPSSVTTISDGAFTGCFNLTSINIPSTVTTLGINVFSGCISLPTITIPSSITSLPDGAFDGCQSLNQITLPSSIITIGNNTFNNCWALSSITIPPSPHSRMAIATPFTASIVTIPPSTTTIGDYAFQNDSSIITVTMSDLVTSIGQGAFDGCTSLTNITLSSELPNPLHIKNGSTTWAQYWGIPNTATIVYPPSDSSLSLITINGTVVSEGSSTDFTSGTTSVTVNATPTQGTSNVISVTGATNLQTGDNIITITVMAQDESTSQHVVHVNVLSTICFLEGSKILCLINKTETYVPIENIRNGTLVKTRTSGYKPVVMIGHSKIYNPGNKLHSKNRLYKLTPQNYPELTDDLIITGCHSILVDELTEEQKVKSIEYTGKVYITEDKFRLIACLDPRAEPYAREGIHNIWHIALEHENYYWNYGIYANGLQVETTSKRMMKELSGMELV
jgi:hypothetical protein